MKLVVVMYLEEDEDCVGRLLEEVGVAVFSEVSLEGHGPGVKGWLGEVAPYRSRMIFTVVEADVAEAVLERVERCRSTADLQHPAHAILLDVERHVTSAGSGEGGREERPSGGWPEG